MMPPVAIIAGGLATRMRPLTSNIPKCLLDVNGRPFLDHQLELLSQHGINRVVICAGHLGEMIRAFAGNGSRWNLHIDYSFDGAKPLGTGGAVKQALHLLGPEFLTLYGDSYLEVDYQAVYSAFCDSGADAMMTVYRNENGPDRSNIRYEKGRVVFYDNAHSTPGLVWIDYGLSVFKKAELNAVDISSFGLGDIFARLAAENRLAGFEAKNPYHEIGSMAGYSRFKKYMGHIPTGTDS